MTLDRCSIMLPLIEWKNMAGLRHSKLLMERSDSCWTKKIWKFSRRQLRIITGVFTGHFGVKGLLAKLGLSDNTGEEPETMKHILCGCHALARQRMNSFGTGYPEPKEFRALPLGSIIRFVEMVEQAIAGGRVTILIQQGALAMAAASLALVYFAAKRLSLLSAFLCWRPEELSALWRDAQRYGMRVRMADWARPALVPYATHREAVLLDMACPGAELVINEASSSRAFNLRHSWLLLHAAPLNDSLVASALRSALILPDADVAWMATDRVVDIYRVKIDQPLVTTPLADVGAELEAIWGTLPAAPTRRKDLNNVYLKASTIITQPQHFKGWADLTTRHVDTFPKLTYPLMLLLAEDLHFRYNMKQVDLYGEERNGSFDGLAGQLQRREVEVGITSMFMRADRIRVLHFCSETVELRGAFIFRQPSKSSVSNVFLLPFSRGVWAATAAVLALAAALLTLLARRPRLRAIDPALKQLSLGETIIFSVGTVCQQGFHLVPELASARVVMFCALMTALFAFTAYSAKIVAILQSPSDAIRTIDDLTRSPMTLGVQETTYKKVYFAESTQPATQRLYKRKLLPLGERAYLSVVDGVARLRTSLFAFQVEEPSGYDIISKTFTEREKCGLKQIQAFKLPMVAVPIRRHSGYKELFATRLRWQRETGLMARSRRTWLAAKTRCDAASGGFVSVGIIDVLPALHVLVGGMAASLVLLASERARRAAGCCARRHKHQPDHTQ